MRLAALIAATAILGLAAHADGVSKRAVKSPSVSPLEATDASYGPSKAPPGHEVGRYRHGATYSVIDADSALACQAACGDDGVCQAWSYVAGYGSAAARCELKQGGGKAEENLLAISGVSPRVDAVIWGTYAPPAPAPSDQLIGEADTSTDGSIALAEVRGSDPVIIYSYETAGAD
ncbi:MAG TPA: PAN domain-containing protein [Hyphomonas sp.]|nr:PAN domain-containing protein [Hyphomonas sp.]HRK66619.1 PAN domain-containing protein [Hyphomonas sp.]